MDKQLKFKTSINCGGCVASVTPALDQVAGKGNWQVDTENPDKVLTVQLPAADEAAVVDAVKGKGYTIEPLNG